MKIEIVPFEENWATSFEAIKIAIGASLGPLEPRIDHIGSTSVPDLSAKPIIDILVGVKHDDELEETVNPLIKIGYTYYALYNSAMPYRRFFVKTKGDHPGTAIHHERDISELLNHANRIAHVHAIPINSVHWLRHLAFKHYLIEHENIKNNYQALKEKLSLRRWRNGDEYNKAKNDFIKLHEEKALKWFETAGHYPR